MKLLRVHIISAETCGGLLDGLDLWFRSPWDNEALFDPLCLIGPNGTGKSQFLQVIAEIFQSVFYHFVRREERVEANANLLFEVEYLIWPEGQERASHVKISRKAEGRKTPTIIMQERIDGIWVDHAAESRLAQRLLPQKVVGYTSGDNETFSVPFLVSRSGYADEVGRQALKVEDENNEVPDTRLMLIDYGTHLEILIANLLLGSKEQRLNLLQDARLSKLHSFRCIVQLAHSAAPRAPRRSAGTSQRKGIQLTPELEKYLSQLQRCATCYNYEDKTETYTFDFLVDDQSRAAFGHFWKSTLEFYSALHKLAMLNDLAIPKQTRDRFKHDTRVRRFASRLPEPQDEDKVFRFERVEFLSLNSEHDVDYVALSDGEHQLVQLLGAFSMVSSDSVLFLLDEPESHFNPLWRVKFVSRIYDLPTRDGRRKEGTLASRQDCLLTTHSPFVPSDMQREKVFIFYKKDNILGVRNPDIETFGSTFDTILEECFGVHPPMSQVPREEIDRLKQSTDVEEIKEGLARLGYSVEKVFLADRLRQLSVDKAQS